MFAKESEVTLPHQNVVPQRTHQVVDPNRLAAGFVGKPFQPRAERADAAPLQPHRAALDERPERLSHVEMTVTLSPPLWTSRRPRRVFCMDQRTSSPLIHAVDHPVGVLRFGCRVARGRATRRNFW